MCRVQCFAALLVACTSTSALVVTSYGHTPHRTRCFAGAEGTNENQCVQGEVAKGNDQLAESQAATQRRSTKHKDVLAKVPPRTGWVMATRALRGEYDPDDANDDTERSSSALLSALVKEYPALYSFKAVGRLDGISADDFCDTLSSLIRAEKGVEDVVDTRWTQRLGGRFASVQIDCIVRSPEAVQQVFDKLNAEERVTMTF